MAITEMDKLMEILSNGFANFYRTAYGKNPPDVEAIGILAALLIIVLLGILIYGLLFDPSMFVHHVVVTAK